MTRRKVILLVLLVAIALPFAYLRCATHNAPAGQPPLAYLDSASLDKLKADFNNATGETRLIVLLSPT